MKATPTIVAALAVAVAALAPFSNANANSVSITYYTIGETDQDANHLAGGVFNNEVQTMLGPDGLPVLNTSAYGCLSSCFSSSGAPRDVLSNGEITYWSPTLNNGGAGATSDVTATLTTSTTLPFDHPSNFFPPNGTGPSDFSGFQAAKIFGTLDVPSGTTENISFSIGADDMAFAYLDGSVVCDLGGVHGSSAGTCITPAPIGPGSHTLDVFFVDINNVQSGLTFDVTTEGITTTPGTSVPEPQSVLLLAMGLLSLGFVRRNRFL